MTVKNILLIVTMLNIHVKFHLPGKCQTLFIVPEFVVTGKKSQSCSDLDLVPIMPKNELKFQNCMILDKSVLELSCSHTDTHTDTQDN